MTDQPELRQRLREVLGEHFVVMAKCDEDAWEQFEAAIDDLLALPGIAIAATGGDAMRWEALRERLERAAATLTAMACKARTEVADDAQQSTRLAGKVSGIRLALSYMQDEENLAAGVAEEQTNA